MRGGPNVEKRQTLLRGVDDQGSSCSRLSRGGRCPPSQGGLMFNTTSGLRRLGVAAVPLIVLVAPVTLATSASAESEQFYFFEETAEAFWAVPHECADGSIVQATLLVRSTRDFESPETEDPEPTARVQYNAPCQDGSQVSWGRRNVVQRPSPAPRTSRVSPPPGRGWSGTTSTPPSCI